ncbi:substrate-binding domain-containing protein (plasmid) [Ralstonia pickettii]|uniref:substrate-binding domain-containing protein n=1 Tax=Ralstonia TaxID=48736 RepID=UPI002714D951|nr:substrate-binding domain-containing protein [Ralstonia pickettii]WKZ88731.1 substrate-binding domain-containing protein [Ralstonia pickettii]
MRLKRFVATAAIALVAMQSLSALADTIDVRGSTTVNSVLITPYMADIERLSGQKLKVSPSNSGEGLTDLIGFSSDVAMTSAPFKDVADQLAKTPNLKGLKIDQREFNVVNLGHAEVLFVVNASNKVSHLTKAQLTGLLTGTIKNWKEVGGEDQPVVIISEAGTGAMRTEISRHLLGGKDFPTDIKTIELANQIPGVVAATPGAIGFMSSALPASQRADVRVIPSDGKIEQTLFVITRPHPSASVESVISAIKDVASKALTH